MGGYGGASGKIKGKCYYDTGGHKVTDSNAIAVAEEYINEGKYVAFLQEKDNQKRADLSVDGVHVEVKGMTTLNPDNIEGKLKKAFLQVTADDYLYPIETNREGKVIIYSRHESSVSNEEILTAMKKGFAQANRKGYILGKVEVWIKNKKYNLN